MSDRGSCKVFSPNIFNPTKCQNCYKPKEGHPSGSVNQTGSKMQRGVSLPVVRERNNSAAKALIKEGFLSFSPPNEDSCAVKEWVKRFYMLYSSGELEEFQIEDGEVMKEKPINVIALRDFIRLVDGAVEIGEENTFGLKSLKEAIYLKAVNKVEFENWWKELSSFVPSQMKRAYSASAASRPPVGNAKPWLTKTYSSPQVNSSKPPITKSPLAVQQEATESAQVDGLNSKINRLQVEVNKIPKLEEDKRKLELEVNYWKEYVTNSNASKRSGGKSDFEKQLNEARIQIIALQDKLDQTEKKIQSSTSTVSKQSKELNDSRAKLEEANNMINMHKATINDLQMELGQRKEAVDRTDGPLAKPDIKSIFSIAEERSGGTLSPVSDTSERGEASDFESKFFNLREKMKRIEKELFLKSKELEKANESRSKVAKYTRTLLQELEAKLNDTQRKMLEASERLSDTTMELELEREKRRRLESEREHGMLSRNSSISSIISNQDLGQMDVQNEPAQLGEIDVSNRYADYYRSRFRESEGSLLEKDKKLSEAETKYKELETKYRNVLKQCRSLDDIQIKLSDATHKLSDRQLKIHELTREVEKLRGYERSYDRKSKELQLSTDKVNALEDQLHELKTKLTVQGHDLEGYKIREVVMKERLSTLEEDSSDDDAEEEEGTDSRLERSIEAKERVERTVDLEGRVRLLASEKELLTERITELEEKVKMLPQSDKIAGEEKEPFLEGEASKQTSDNELDELREKMRMLEDKLIKEEDKFYTEISELKERHRNELETAMASSRHSMQQYTKLKEDFQCFKNEIELKESERVTDLEKVGSIELDPAAAEKQVKELEEVIGNLKKQVEDNSLKLCENDNTILVKDEKIQELMASVEQLNSDLQEKNLRLQDVTQKNSDIEQILMLKSDNFEQMQTQHEVDNSVLQNLENENARLREDLNALEKRLLAISEKKGVLENEVAPSVDVGNIDQLSQGAEVEVRAELSKAKELLLSLQSGQTECKIQLEESSRKYLESEQKVIDLSQELESRIGMEKDLKEEIIAIQSKIEAMRKQLGESQESLQFKSLELEKERNNISHLVDVTSAYIKELENSLTESRGKIDELESVVEEARNNNGQRMPPDGISGKDREDSLSDTSDLESGANDKDFEIERERLNAENERLKAKLSSLESELAGTKTSVELDRQNLVELNQIPTTDNEQDRPVSDNEDGSEQSNDVLEADPLESLKGEGNKKLIEYSNFDLRQLQERIVKLESELVETNRSHKEAMKLKDDSFSKLMEEHKEEMERTISETVKALSGSISSQSNYELEDKIRELEKEIEEMRVRYEDELDAEKEAHQVEMEETIRDMLTVTEVFKSGKYNEKEDSEDGVSQKGSRRSSVVSQEGMEEIRKEYEKKLTLKEEECQKSVENMKQDMLKVIDAIQQGGASAAILDLTNKSQMLRKELDQTIADFEIEREDLKMKIERLESNNFFGLRRNEEMGSKIFQMQSELEEMERKHKLELEVYQNKENSEAIQEVVKVNEALEKKVRKLELDLQESKDKSIEEMELIAMKVQEEKRVSISEMTDTVLSLEAIIDEMKDKHEEDLRELEARTREEKLEALDKLQLRIDELEDIIIQTKDGYEERLAIQEEDYKEVIQGVKNELEAKIEYFKALSEERPAVVSAPGNDSDLQEKYNALRIRCEELEKELHSKVEELKQQHSVETEAKQRNFDNQISEIRSEYEEKLKSCIKESARRHSISTRKTESQKNKELSTKVMELEMALEERQKEYQTEIEDYKQIVENLQSLVAELRGESKSHVDGQEPLNSQDTTVDTQDNAKCNDKKPNKRVEELESQIQGFEKRIAYYKRKAERDEESENSRVSELQQEVRGLRKEMNELTERHSQESLPGLETEKVSRRRSETTDRTAQKSAAREQNKRWSDLHLTDMVFTNDGVQSKRSSGGRDSWKRWSDLQLKQDSKLFPQLKKDEIAKSGSVARRKKLWEQGDEHQKFQRPLSSIRP